MSLQVDRDLIQTALETAIRIAAVAVLAFWSWRILAPFFSVLVWAAIIAVAVFPAYRSLAARIGERQRAAATICVARRQAPRR